MGFTLISTRDVQVFTDVNLLALGISSVQPAYFLISKQVHATGRITFLAALQNHSRQSSVPLFEYSNPGSGHGLICFGQLTVLRSTFFSFHVFHLFLSSQSQHIGLKQTYRLCLIITSVDTCLSFKSSLSICPYRKQMHIS